MNRLRVVALLVLAAAGLLLLHAALTGDLHGGFFLVVPFLSGTGPSAALGVLALMAGLVLLFLSTAPPAPPRDDPAPDPRHAAREDAAPRRRHGGVILLGPIPIAWGSDRRILPWMVLAGFLLLAFSVAVGFLLR